MTNIAIIGLGLMGASFAKKLTHLNYNVYGIDVSEQTIDKAKELKIIVDGSTNPLDVISKCDTFIFCLYPTKILPWIEVYQNDIPKHSLLMDISGVKTNIVKPIQDVLREDLELLSIHPMCGRESRGIEFSDETIFKGSNFILVPTQKNKSETVEAVKELAHKMEFGRICTLSIPNVTIAKSIIASILIVYLLTACFSGSLGYAKLNPRFILLSLQNLNNASICSFALLL